MTELVTRWSDLFLSWSWQALLLLALTWLIVRGTDSRTPAVRHRLWLFGMIAVAVLPVLMSLLKLLPALPPTSAPLSSVTGFPVAVRIASDPVFSLTSVSPDWSSAAGAKGVLVVRTILFIAWLLGFAWSLGILCRSWWKMHHIRKNAREISPPLVSAVVRVGLAAELTSPVLAGWFRPMILLPGKFLEWTTTEERHAFVLHEEAHFRRRDHYLIVIQRLLERVFFFHPMVRYASRQLSLERELACDEDVLRAGVDPAAYADAILKVAEWDLQRRGPPQPAFNSSRKILERRIDMIFKGHHRLLPEVSGRFATVLSVLGLIAVMSCLLIPQSSLAESPSPGAELQMIRETLSKYAPKVVSTPVQVAQSPILPVAATLVRVPIASTQAALAVQSQTSSISGKILDPSGAVIPGVAVRVKGTQLEFAMVTDETGAFSFSQVPADRYRLEASLPGFAPKVFTFVLGPGGAWRQNLFLALAAMNTYVEVSASRPALPGPTTPATAPGVAPPPLRVGGVISQAQLISQVKPVYPPAARAAGLQGDVLIHAILGKDGSVMDPAVISRGVDPELAQAALDAVRQWRYRPAMLNGQPVEVVTEIGVSFSLVD